MASRRSCSKREALRVAVRSSTLPWYTRPNSIRAAAREGTDRATCDTPDGKPAKRRQTVSDATWTKQHGKRQVGDKLSINVDKRYKFIRKNEVDTASTPDSQHFDTVFATSNTSRAVYAARGYPSAAREA